MITSLKKLRQYFQEIVILGLLGVIAQHIIGSSNVKGKKN